MKPVDFRNETFAQLKGRLAGWREKVWLAWTAYEVRHGTAGATTRTVAQWSKIDILTFRPRSTELYQLGALRLVEPVAANWSSPDSENGGSHQRAATEGFYRLRSDADWQAWHESVKADLLSRQQQLPLTA